MHFGKIVAFCALACVTCGSSAFADYTNSPNYTGVSNGKQSTVGTYGTRDLSQGPHFTAPHYTPPHFDTQGNYHDSHQSYGHYVDPYSTPSTSTSGRHRRNGY